jgi:ferredoxin
MADRPGTRVSIDPELCIGSGECVRVAPSGFRIDEARGVSTPLPGVESLEPDVLAEVAFNCPTHAITVKEAAA